SIEYLHHSMYSNGKKGRRFDWHSIRQNLPHPRGSYRGLDRRKVEDTHHLSSYLREETNWRIKTINARHHTEDVDPTTSRARGRRSDQANDLSRDSSESNLRANRARLVTQADLTDDV